MTRKQGFKIPKVDKFLSMRFVTIYKNICHKINNNFYKITKYHGINLISNGMH